jgi:hypothetical protein
VARRAGIGNDTGAEMRPPATNDKRPEV